LTESVWLLGKFQDDEKTPFVSEAVEDVPNGAFSMRLGPAALKGGG
jgi:hypothetical protein